MSSQQSRPVTVDDLRAYLVRTDRLAFVAALDRLEEQLEQAAKVWPLVLAVKRAYDHGNLDGDVLDAWMEYRDA